MFIKLILFFLLSQTLRSSSQILTYNGFNPPTDISLQGLATVTPNGLLKLTNTTVQKTGHAFYTKPVRFKDSPNATVSSFSTTFVFAIYSQIPTLSGHGIAFVISPSPALPYALPSQYIGLFNNSNNGNDTNHVFAVEFDTIQSNEFGDPNDNHYSTAGYWKENNKFQNLNLISRKLMQVWINYDELSNKIDVTMSPYGSDKPSKPLITYVTDLSSVLLQDMYVGFASATGSVISEHYVAGWSFRLNGEAPSLTSSNLPKLPRFEQKRISDFYKIGMPLISLFLFFSVISLAFYWVFGLWLRGNIMEAKDPNLGCDGYDLEEVEMVLKLGLLCSHSDPRARPSMRLVLQYLRGDMSLPELTPLDLSAGNEMNLGGREGFSGIAMSYYSSVFNGFTGVSSIADSLLSGGR
ncbi:unnamed protein product [Brassica napus]|uniref:non-specific serine/threonine protein kinase n=1 Tax=Brassica napus TaxID=3708 RepID=A0A816UKQ8_BRANA|nr:unnamed protein product [Brassica napus]